MRDIKIDTTLYVSHDDLKEIIKQYFATKGIEVSSVNWNFTKEMRGYGPGEQEFTDFKGVTLYASKMMSFNLPAVECALPPREGDSK
ncbi:MAG TPA: hypothetical protein VFM18_17530 [Methanosarcina sp.]|nr:hypothetical protein [Methanosarcina sp.]